MPLMKFKIQPVSLVYTHLGGRPIVNNDMREETSWHRDSISLAAHLKNWLGYLTTRTEIHIHAPISNVADRKKLAHQAESVVAAHVDRVNRDLVLVGERK